MTRVLLTSVIRPFGGPGEGDSVGAELFHAQVTRAQGAFSLRQVIRVWGLDLIAENLEAPTVVLHYPSLDELSRELRHGAYTHVGINFVVATFHKVRAMVALIRRVSPRSQIILGGYGTVLPDELLRPYGDLICREEGVGFMRRVLGEDESRPIRPAHSPVPAPASLGYQQQAVVGHVAAGLGCANGCDFCCTSHFFRRKHIRLVPDGAALYEALRETKRRAERDGQRMESFALIDEDFFLYRRRAEEFLEAVRRGGEPLSLFGFGSIKGLSQFTAAEIAEMGFDLIWTAFEGTESGYAKLQGRPIGELYSDLRDHGVALLSSMIIGFPYQDERTIWAEFEQLMALEPALVQVLIYFAFPGTPFFEQVMKEGRFLPEYERSPDLRRFDGFALHMDHPHFTPAALEALQRRLYAEDFRRLGPSVYRTTQVYLRGAERLRASKSPILRARAEQQLKAARWVMPTSLTAQALLPSQAARARAQALRADLIRLTGAPTLRERLQAPLVLGLALASEAAARLGVLQQPALLRVEHRTGAAAEIHTGAVLGLQGRATPLWQRAREDLQHLVLDRLRPPETPPVLSTEGWPAIPPDRGSVIPPGALIPRSALLPRSA